MRSELACSSIREWTILLYSWEEADGCSGPSLATSGPGSMLIGYAMVGVLCYAVMAAMVRRFSAKWFRSGLTRFNRAKWLHGYQYPQVSQVLHTDS